MIIIIIIIMYLIVVQYIRHGMQCQNKVTWHSNNNASSKSKSWMSIAKFVFFGVAGK